MAKTAIENAPTTDRFSTSAARTNLSQRRTLETTMTNLGSVLGIKVIYRQFSSSLETFYEPQGGVGWSYQSASNTILEMSERLLKEREKRRKKEAATREGSSPGRAETHSGSGPKA